MIIDGIINILNELNLYEIYPKNNDINNITVFTFPTIELLFLLKSPFSNPPFLINFVQFIIIIINSNIKVIIKYLFIKIICQIVPSLPVCFLLFRKQ